MTVVPPQICISNPFSFRQFAGNDCAFAQPRCDGEWFHCMQAVGSHFGAVGKFLLARRWAREKQRDGIYTVHSKFRKNDYAFEVQPLVPVLHSLPVQRMKGN